jgi:hypothetical protein
MEKWLLVGVVPHGHDEGWKKAGEEWTACGSESVKREAPLSPPMEEGGGEESPLCLLTGRIGEANLGGECRRRGDWAIPNLPFFAQAF